MIALGNNVQDVLRRAQTMVADGHNGTSEVAALIGDIGRLPDADRKQLFDAFDEVKQQSGAPKSREAVDVVLRALRDKPAQLLAQLEGNDGVIDMREALQALAQTGAAPNARVSVFTAMLFAKATPEAKQALLNFAAGLPPMSGKQIDEAFRALSARGNIKPEEMTSLKTAAGSDGYASYMLSFWSMVLPASKFAPGGQQALHAAAEETYHQIPRNDKEDLELNRGRPVTTRGAHTLDLFSRELLQLPFPVSFSPGGYVVDVNGDKKTFTSPDVLAAFLMEAGLKRAGHGIDSVTFNPAKGGSYCLQKGAVSETFRFHCELLRQFGYRA